jgi:DNA-binding transcriptional LysR family regulator
MDRGDKYFLVVAATRSLRKAADQLRVASSAISRQISLLEKELGIELFERAPHGMILTAAGDVYLSYLHNVLQDAERVKSELDALKGLQRGHVRVFSVEGLAGDFMMRGCLTFQERYPGITIELTIAGSHLVAHAVRERDADVGISMNAKKEDGIDIVHSVEDPLLVVMAPGHELSGSAPQKVADIVKRFPVALPPASFGIRSLVDACLHEKPSPVLVTNSIEALRAFARMDGGVTFLPHLAVREDLATGRLVSVELSDKSLKGIVIDAYVSRGRRPTLPAATFLSFLRTMV